MNLSVSCYPDQLEYVDQILGYASEKIKEFGERCEFSILYALSSRFNVAAVLIFTHHKRRITWLLY